MLSRLRALWRKVKGYRTVAFNTLAGLLAVVQVADLAVVVPPEHLAKVTIAYTIANILLRLDTTGPVGGKREDD